MEGGRLLLLLLVLDDLAGSILGAGLDPFGDSGWRDGPYAESGWWGAGTERVWRSALICGSGVGRGGEGVRGDGGAVLLLEWGAKDDEGLERGMRGAKGATEA